ncbi:hypothetical protein [Flavobacterium piscinae]|uniref:hypothetical protein n=1 Tax=Flavobacterium piscinae TaxID=2506424 RepID=UPI002AAC2AB7|nr:hypothetical protein [Flavobacterium piscinae]
MLGNDWSLILTDVNKGDDGNGERMGYIFDNRRVQLSGLACELVKAARMDKYRFKRSTY